MVRKFVLVFLTAYQFLIAKIDLICKCLCIYFEAAVHLFNHFATEILFL